MDHADVEQIVNFTEAVENAKRIQQKFLGILSQNEANPMVSAKLKIEDGVLHAECFGHATTARPRIVKLKNSCATEYRFTAVDPADEKNRVEVWRFYLNARAEVCRELSNDKDFICNVVNAGLTTEISGGLLIGAINSKLFSPVA